MSIVTDALTTKKYFFAEVVIRQGLKALVTKFAILSFLTGPLNFLFLFIGTKALSFLMHETILGASIIYRRFRTKKDKENYLKAVEETYANQSNKKNLSWEQKVALEEALVEATRNFIRIRGLRR